MAGPIKAVLVAIIASAALFLLTHLAFFFPFYMTIVVETFNLANVAANDNYVKYEYWEDRMRILREREIFSKGDQMAGELNKPRISITVTKGAQGESLVSAIGDPGESGTDYYYDIEGWPDERKPYRQRGEPVTVTVEAPYPYDFTMWGRSLKGVVPVRFSITTTGLKYYKDLPYDLYD